MDGALLVHPPSRQRRSHLRHQPRLAPSRNVIDGFAGVTVGATQHNYRISRRLCPNPLETAAGALHIEVLEGLRRHRLRRDPNETGVSFDIEFAATMSPHEEKLHCLHRSGRLTVDMARAQQLGSYRGWLQVRERRIGVDAWPGRRDHSWGVRRCARTSHPPLTLYPPFFFAWTTMQFADRSRPAFVQERVPGEFIYLSGEEVLPLGTMAKSGRPLASMNHDMKGRERQQHPPCARAPSP